MDKSMDKRALPSALTRLTRSIYQQKKQAPGLWGAYDAG